MSALLAVSDTLVVGFTHSADFVLATAAKTGGTDGGSQKLVDAIRNFVGPIFLLCIGIAALSFLFQRQITQFLQFAALAVGIAVFFYTPGIVPAVASFFSDALGVSK